MKFIFSRKGFDSEFGSADSPILPDNRMISLPIPSAERESGISYKEIFVDKNKSYFDLMTELGIKIPTSGQCHLDPDLRYSTIKRDKDWRPIFGQSGIQRNHLSKTNVEKGDVFLFFGSFRRTNLKDNKLVFTKEHSRHIIFGYLIVDEIWDLGKEGIQNFKTNNPSKSWAFEHPHFYYESEKNNAVFVSQKKQAGIFKYNDELALTKLGYLKSVWELPSFFSPDCVSISYHQNEERFQKQDNNILLQTVGKGQEFVVKSKDNKTEKELEKWLNELLVKAETYD